MSVQHDGQAELGWIHSSTPRISDSRIRISLGYLVDIGWNDARGAVQGFGIPAQLA